MTWMRESRQEKGTDTAAKTPVMLLLCAAAMPLAGCVDLPSGMGAWGYVALSLAVVALGAHRLGQLRERAARRPVGQRLEAQAPNSPRQAETAAAALHAAFDAHPQACAVAIEAAAGWQVAYLNRAGADQWTGLRVGGDLRSLPLDPDLQPHAGAALQAQPFSGAQPGDRGLLLTAPAPADLRREAEQRAKQAAARETERESASFSFTVSHDLRAPIRVVEGFTRIVKEDYGRQLDRVGNDHLDRVLGAAARMNLMIDALLTLARLSEQPLSRQPVNMSQLAAFVVDDLRKSGPEREAEIEIEAGLLAQGDPTLLRLVLENLLGNAWKYSQRRPRTVISLRSVAHEAGRAFVVRDNGAGFDMRSADRLFGIFQRLHSVSEFPGHGVGLASVRRIVRRHGGEIWAEAETGRGAAFFFTLAR